MATTEQPERLIAGIVAFAFVDGVWWSNLMAARAVHDLQTLAAPWITEAAELACATFPDGLTHATDRLVELLAGHLVESASEGTANDPVLGWIRSPNSHKPDSWSPPTLSRFILPTMGVRRWPVAEVATPGELASLLNVGPTELEWYADLRRLERTVPTANLRHYNYLTFSKAKGGVRLVEAPKQNLKRFQRWILRSILDHVPAHSAAHGFVRGRSIQTYVAPHTAQPLVLKMDLQNFFTSINGARVIRLFEALGYPPNVSRQLAGLTTNSTPPQYVPDVNSQHMATMLKFPHLPQGAPTSPALANLVCYGLDSRLQALANRFEVRYTRYADDLAFSGPAGFEGRVERFLSTAASIVEDEGFRVNPDKTRLRRQSDRQVIAGLVVNRHANVHRVDYDRLKAILHDAVTHGPTHANRHDHPQFRSRLEGRIGFVQATNPQRARKLWTLFDRITW